MSRWWTVSRCTYIVCLPENMTKWVALYEWTSRIFEMQSNPKSPPVESCLPAPQILLLRNFVTIPWNIVCYKWCFEAKFSKQPLKVGGAVLCSLQYLISHLFWSNFLLFFSFSIFPPFFRRPLQYKVDKHTHIRDFDFLKLHSNLTAEQLCAGMSKKNRLKMAFRGVSLTHFPKSVVYMQWSHPDP